MADRRWKLYNMAGRVVYLSWMGIQPLHIIVAFDEGAKLCVVVTVYIPDPELWENDFKTRRKK